MKLTLEPTKHFFMAGNVMVRLWEGTQENGQPAQALIAGVILAGDLTPQGLVSIPEPTADDQRKWAEHILRGTQPDFEG